MATSPIYNWPEPDNTDLVKNGALAIRTLGNAIDTTMATMVSKTIVDAKGDLIAGTAADTVSRLAVGANNTVLTADSSTATGLKWAAPAGGGKVLQVVEGKFTGYASLTTSTFTDSGVTVTITPSATSSKVLIFATLNGVLKNTGSASSGVKIQLLRGATAIGAAGDRTAFTNTSVMANIGSVSINTLDSPATTSATTYKVQIASSVNGQLSAINDYDSANTSICTIIAMEIGA